MDADRTRSDSQTIRIPVVVFEATDAAKGSAPVLFLSGGPSPALAVPELTAAVWEKRLSAFTWLEGRGLVVFDYRGTGLSNPSLKCPELESQTLNDVEKEKFELKLRICLRKAEAQGVNLSVYNTRAIAADVEDLRIRLGIQTWNIWSVSFGTRVALKVIRSKPESVRSAILSGVLPPSKTDWWSFSYANLNDVLRELLEDQKGQTRLIRVVA